MNPIQISFLEIFYLFGTFHGLTIACILLLSKKSHRGTTYLAILILLFSFYLFENVLYSSGYIRYAPHFLLTTLPLTFLIGPPFYFYVLKSASTRFFLRPIHLLHLIPFVIEVVILLPFYRLSSETKVMAYDQSLSSTDEWKFSIIFAGYLVYVLSAAGYFIVSYRKAVERSEGKILNPQLTWLRQASLALLIYVVAGLAMSLYLFVDGSVGKILYHANLLLQTILIQLVGYTAFVKPRIFQIPEGNGKKYKFSTLTPAVMDELHLQFRQIMDTDKPYLNPELLPEHIALKLGITKHQLSQLMSESMQTSFYDCINTYRIAEARNLLSSDSYRNAKIIHVAFDSGFSNKSTFLRSFRKVTGQTPSEFRNNLEKEVAHN